MSNHNLTIKNNSLIKANFHINEQWALKELTKKAQFHHYVGAWYVAGLIPDIWYSDKNTTEEPTIIKGDAEGKFLYKVIRIPNFSEYLKAIGRPKTTNYGFERDAIKSICVVPKVPVRYHLKTKDGRPYTSEVYGASIMRYRVDITDSNGIVFYDQIELGGWEGIVDCAWSAMSVGVIPHLKDLSVYGFRILLELQDYFRRNYHNSRVIKYAGEEAVFVRKKEDFEKRIGMDKLKPIQRIEEWIRIQYILTCQSKMVSYIWVPPSRDPITKKLEQSRFGRKKAIIKHYHDITRKDNPAMNRLTHLVGNPDSIMIILPWHKWCGMQSELAKKMEGKTKQWATKKHGVTL